MDKPKRLGNKKIEAPNRLNQRIPAHREDESGWTRREYAERESVAKVYKRRGK